MAGNGDSTIRIRSGRRSGKVQSPTTSRSVVVPRLASRTPQASQEVNARRVRQSERNGSRATLSETGNLSECRTTGNRDVDRVALHGIGARLMAGTTRRRARSDGCRCWTTTANQSVAKRIGRQLSWRWARVKVAGDWRPEAEPSASDEWQVARVCSEYIEYCRRGATASSISVDYAAEVTRRLNQLCEYCGSLPISQLSKGHVEHWVESQTAWQSPVTRRNAITIVLAAFNRARDMHDVKHRLKGLKKPPSRPRLHSFTAGDEISLYEATDEVFGDFLYAAIHTGLRPFCELARLTTDDIVETDRGMMWRVYSSKTKKTRKIPVVVMWRSVSVGSLSRCRRDLRSLCFATRRAILGRK